MNVIVIFCCLFCAIFANPITINKDFEPPELNTTSTEPSLVAQASGNETSEVQSSESESSESVESTSSDSTSEESDSVESSEHTEMLVETRDDSMGSEEIVRKSWVRVFATVVRDTSVEDNSTEVKGQQPEIVNKLEEKQPIQAPIVKTSKQSDNPLVSLLQRAIAVSESSSESAQSTDHSTALMTATADSSSQSLSSESNETSSSSSSSSSSEASDSASNSASNSTQSSESDEDSPQLTQIRHCLNGTQSCESQEYFFQDIGDDANYSVDNLMVPDEDDRELTLRR